MKRIVATVLTAALAGCGTDPAPRPQPAGEETRTAEPGRPPVAEPPPAAAAGGNAAGDPGQGEQPFLGLPDVVAEMEGHKITRDEFLKRAVEWYGREVLEEIILKYVFERAVADSGASITPKELDDRVDQEIREREKETQQKYNMPLKQYLAQFGKTPEQLRTEMRANEDMQRQILLEYMLVYAYETEPKVEISHILVRDASKAEALRKQASDGLSDFGELAKKESDDGGSAPNGGKLPPFIRGMTRLGEGFEDAAFALEKAGDISPAVLKTEMGYHVLRLNKKWPAAPQKFDSLRDRIRTAQKDRTVLDSFMRRLRARYVKGLKYAVPDLEPKKR